jgi:WD40 repeat protein
LNTGRILRTLEGHTNWVNGVAVTSDGKQAVSASGDHTLKVWDLETGLALRTLEGHSSYVSGVAVTPDGTRAVSASGDNTLKVWDLETGLPLATFHCDASPRCCTFAGGQTIIAGDAGGQMHFLRLEERR